MMVSEACSRRCEAALAFLVFGSLGHPRQMHAVRAVLNSCLRLGTVTYTKRDVEDRCQELKHLCVDLKAAYSQLGSGDVYRQALEWASASLCWLVETVRRNASVWLAVAGQLTATTAQVNLAEAMSTGCVLGRRLDEACHGMYDAVRECHPTRLESVGRVVAGARALVVLAQADLTQESIRRSTWAAVVRQLTHAGRFVLQVCN
jgi:hypothetical protein